MIIPEVPLLAQPQIEIQPFATGFNNPLGIVNAGDSRLFVVEQGGLIRIVDSPGVIQEPPFLDLSGIVSQSGNERGLLGLAFHPDYNENGYFFVDYTRSSDGNTVIARFKRDENNPNLADQGSEVKLLTIEQPYSNHNGGQLQFGPDGYLYIGLGDGGSGGDPNNNAQNKNSFLGKILRINVSVDEDSTYTIPEDNPFVNDDAALDEIWAYGLRNPWRFSFDRYTNDLWIADVGQDEWEEIDFEPANDPGGNNYGWRCYEGNQPYNTSACTGGDNYVFPVYDYNHQATSGCSVTGGYVYRGALYNQMFGKYFFTDFCSGKFYYIDSTSNGFESHYIDQFDQSSYASFGEDRYGELYIALRGSGEIRKVVETGDCTPVARIMENEPSIQLNPGENITVHAFYHPSLEYQWYKNDQPFAGENQSTLNITGEGSYYVRVTNPDSDCTNTSDAIEVVVNATAVVTGKLSKISIYPNPATNKLNIGNLPGTGKSYIRITDIKGKTVFSKSNFSGSFLTVPTEHLSGGVYLIEIRHNTEIFNKKLW